MKNRVCITSFVSVLVVLVLVSGAQATRHCGVICNQTWEKADNPHIVTCDVTVDEGCWLRLKPGVRVYFYDNTKMVVNGTLNAIGLESDRIFFTSARDTLAGGVPGDWWGIRINGTSVDDTLQYCTIRYGGAYGSSIEPAVDIGGSSPVFLNCAVYSNYNVAFKCNGGRPLIHDCSVYNNGGDAYWVTNLAHLPEIYFSGGVSQMNSIVYGNHGNGIRFDGGTMSEDAVVPDMGPCYWLKATHMTIAGGTSLTFGQGVIWKTGDNLLIDVSGTLKATSAVLTSYRDDERQDTNGGGASGGVPGDWWGIRFEH